MGFILEAAVEALPQSLLQIVAIVYYKEANYVSIISIFLSMFSVMTKSLVFSQGIEIKTYIWTWLCIVVDFFGIFFTLTWVFYTNDNLLQPVFLGYFSIIGQMWIYKIMISICPIVVGGILLWLTYFMLKILAEDIWYSGHTDSFCTKFCWTLFIIIFGTIGVILAAPFGFIGIEIFCFSLMAFIVYSFSTLRWANYTKKLVNDTINEMLQFILKKDNRNVRILVANYFSTKAMKYSNGSIDLNSFIDTIDAKQGFKGLQKVKLREIREHAQGYSRKRKAKIWAHICYEIKNGSPSKDDYADCLCCKGSSCGSQLDNIFEYVIIWWLIILFCPIFFVGKLFQVIFPYIIIIYLTYYQHWMDIDLFQLVMLLTYIVLQLILLIMGVNVMRIHWFLWHIQPGYNYINFDQTLIVNSNLLLKMDNFYEKRASIPFITKYILSLFGHDIGSIIMDYFHNINLISSHISDDKSYGSI